MALNKITTETEPAYIDVIIVQTRNEPPCISIDQSIYFKGEEPEIQLNAEQARDLSKALLIMADELEALNKN